MKAPVLLVSILALSLAGCGGPLWKESKETVIEKPVASQPSREIVVQQAPPREIIVEKPVVVPRSCVMGSSTFNHGSLSCQTGYQYRCDDGRWLNNGALC
jgi:hypothetical protein